MLKPKQPIAEPKPVTVYPRMGRPSACYLKLNIETLYDPPSMVSLMV